MTGAFLQTARVVFDPLAKDVSLIILVIALALGLVYLLRIHIAYRMPLFFSPLLTWIILLIVGDDKSARSHTDF